MAQKLLLQVDLNDKGTPKVKVLGEEIKKLGKTSLDTGDVLKNVFISKVVLDAFRMFTQAVRNSSRELVEFQDRMVKVGAIGQATAKDMNFMKDELVKMADTSEHSINNLSTAMLELAKTGVPPQKSMGFLADATNLATAAQGEMSSVMLAMINTMKTYNMNLSESTRVADVMYGVIAGTTTDIEGLTFAMSAAAPVAAAMGVEYEELAAMIGLLHDQGLRGTIAGHSLKNTMLNLLSPSEEVRNMIEGMAEEGFTLTEILSQLKKQGISVHEQLDTFQKRAITAVLALGNLEGGVEDATGAITEMTEQLRNSGGIAQRVAQQIRTTSWKAIGEQIRNAFLNSFEAFARFLDEGGLSERLLKIRDVILDLRQTLLDNEETLRRAVAWFMKITAVIGKGFVKALKFAIENADLLVIAMGTFLGLKVVGSVMAMVKAFNLLGLAMVKNAVGLANLGKGIKAAKLKMVAFDRMTKITGKNMLVAMGPKGWVIAGLIAGVTALTAAWTRHFNRVREMNERANLLGEHSEEAISNTVKMYKEHLALREDFELQMRSLDRLALQGNMNAIDAQIKLEEEFSERLKKLFEQRRFDGLRLNKMSDMSTAEEIQKRINFLKGMGAEGDRTGSDFDPQFFRDLITSGSGRGRGGGGRASMDLSMGRAAGMGMLTPTMPDLPQVQAGGSVAPVRGASYMPEFDITGLLADWDTVESQLKTISENMNLQVSVTEGLLADSFARIKEEYDTLVREAKVFYAGDPEALAKALKDLEKNRSDSEMVYTEHYAKVVETARQAELDKQNILKEGIKLMEDTLQQELEFQQEWIKALAQDTQEYWMEQREAYLETMLVQLQIVDEIHNHSLAQMQQRHAKEMQMLTRRKDYAIAMTQEDVHNRRILMQEFYRLEEKLADDHEKEELARKRRGKVAAIIEAGINTALAVTKTLSSIGFPANVIAAAAVGALGLVQTGIIATKNYRWGGAVVTGQGNATSDSVNAKLSVGENVLDAGTVDAVGGHAGVQQMIDERLDYSLGSRQDKPIVVVENFIGTKEYERGLVERLEMEAERW